MGIFGWSYPPGAANDPFAPYNQVDPPCAICGNFEEECICPECTVCGSIGDETCYTRHGMVRSIAQVESLAAAEKRWAEES